MSIEKRNNKYYCKFQINGERHHYLCAGASTKLEAERIENAFKYKIQQMQNGIIPREEKKQKKLKLRDLKENFLKYSAVNRSVYKQDEGRLKIAFQFFDENRAADEVTRKDIEAFKEWMLKTGRTKKTINLYLGIFRVMFNLAVKDEEIAKNPFKKENEFKLEPVKIKYLEKSGDNILLSAAPDYFKDIIITALNTGLRRGNIINLEWSNLDFNFHIIEITKNKGNKHIKLPMNNVLYNLFKNKERISKYVFTNPRTGDKWNTTVFNEEWRKIRARAQMPELKFHGLRHTVCTRLIKEGVPLPVVKEIMAHSDIKTTMQYNHIESLDMINAMDILNSYH